MNEEGFTLIEVLIAITITGILIGAVLMLFDMGVSTWQRTDMESDWQQSWRILDANLENDIHNIFYSSLYNGELFKATYNKVEWKVYGEDSIKKVSYSIDYSQNQLVKRVVELDMGFTTEVEDENGTEEELRELKFFTDLELNRVNFSFYDLENGYWRNSWSYEEIGYLPSVIKVSISTFDLKLPEIVIEVHADKKF